MNYTQPSTLEDSLRFINNIRQEDKREVEGMGQTIFDLPALVITSSHATTFFDAKGVLAGMAGIVDQTDGSGQIWMLCTPTILTSPITFIRQAKKWLRDKEQYYSMFWNHADTRNLEHHKLLRHLGFKALRIVPVGPDQLLYYEIVKLCV
jgi:hypothetical protein